MTIAIRDRKGQRLLSGRKKVQKSAFEIGGQGPSRRRVAADATKTQL
jgi:hypothetical protein